MNYMETKLMVDVPMWYETNGISRIRIDGPHDAPENYGARNTRIFKLSAWIARIPGPSDAPDFYAEMDHASLINLRNALSAALFMADK